MFSFAGSSAATFKGYKDESSTNVTGVSDPLLRPSPYNLPSIYPQVIRFDEEVFECIARQYVR